jgi:serine/threonine-protein kinase
MSTNQLPPEERPEPVGKVWAGRYRLVDLLGEGGMGRVYLALDQHLQARVVLKTPLAELMQDKDFRHRFGREVLAMVRLRHPGIVTVLDYLPDHVPPFFVVEHMEKGSLAKWKPQGGGTAALLWWLLPIARALDYIHSQRHAHRDVKPSNILIDHCDQVRLGDFGIVKALGASTMTRKDSLLGSLPYMSAESLNEDLFPDLNPELRWFRSDQYALAVTVYEMLSGKQPFSVVSRLDPKSEAKPIHLARTGLPAALSPALAKGLAYDPRDRYDSCEALARAVLRAAEDATEEVALREAKTILPGPQTGRTDADAHSTLTAQSGDGQKQGQEAATPPSQTVPLPTQIAAPPPPGRPWQGLTVGAVVGVLLSAAAGALLLPFLRGPASPAFPDKAALEKEVAARKAAESERDALAGAKTGLEKEVADLQRQLRAKSGDKLPPKVRELVVGPGGFPRLSDALAAAKTAERIRLEPGEYKEDTLSLEKAVEIVGAGKGQVTLTVSRPVAVAADVRLSGVTLQGGDPGPRTLMSVMGGAPLLVDCRLLNTADVLVVEGAVKVRLERCEVVSAAKRALAVGKGGTLALADCERIQGKENGLEVEEGGRAELVGCKILGSKTGANVDVAKGSSALLRKCLLSDGTVAAVATEGQTTLEDCDVTANSTGVKVEAGTLRLRECRFSRGNFGLFVPKGDPDSITAVDCVFKGGKQHHVKLATGKAVVFHNCRFEDTDVGADEAAVELAGAVNASFSECTFAGARGPLLKLRSGAAASLARCELTKSDAAAVWAEDDRTTAILQTCSIKGNALGLKGVGKVLFLVFNTDLQENNQTPPPARLLTLDKLKE